MVERLGTRARQSMQPERAGETPVWLVTAEDAPGEDVEVEAVKGPSDPTSAPPGEENHPDQADDVLGLLLARNVEVVVAALRRGESERTVGWSRLAALAAARTVVEVADDVLRALVVSARAGGHTWQEVGDVLRITRQAAQQRFGDRQGGDMERGDTSAFGAQAIEVVEAWRDHRWEELRDGFGAILAERLSIERLQAAWQQVEAMVGGLQGIGHPSVARQGQFQVVDVPLAFERGPMKARVTYHQDGRISGLFVLYPESP